MIRPRLPEPAHTSHSGWIDLLVAVAFLVIVTKLDLEPSRSFDPRLLALFFPLIVVLHELGHVAAAVVLGHRVLEIRIGVGPSVAVRIARWRLALGLFPLGGHLLAGSLDPAGYRWKRLVMIAAGPGVNALLFVSAPPFGVSSAVWRDFALVNACVLVLNLLPYSVRTPYGPQRTDGLGILRTAFGTDRQLADERSGFAVAAAAAAGERDDWDEAHRIADEAFGNDPHSPVLRAWLGMTAVTEGRYAAARDIFRDLVDDDRRTRLPILGFGTGTDEVNRAIHLNNMAWSDLMLGDPTLIEEAVETSGAALALLPDHPAVRGTRSYALIAAGRPREGIELGLAAYSKTKEARARALQASVLAIGYTRDWRFPQAERWIVQARRWDPDCPLLDEARRELDARRQGGAAAVESR